MTPIANSGKGNSPTAAGQAGPVVLRLDVPPTPSPNGPMLPPGDGNPPPDSPSIPGGTPDPH